MSKTKSNTEKTNGLKKATPAKEKKKLSSKAKKNSLASAQQGKTSLQGAKKVKVAELFAGVGGFRLGLEGWHNKSAISGYKKKFNSRYKVVWSNQFEPATKIQHASNIYEARFGDDGHTNIDIMTVDIASIPKHQLLVGGFPCQDYSVARTLSQAAGIHGKKGVLWWGIHRILEAKRTPYVFLENVDRLLKSPVKQRGRDFAIILASLSDLGYAVEWRVINAADYGFPQRRRRTFFVAYHASTSAFNKLKKDPLAWLMNEGVFAKGFPVEQEEDLDIEELFPAVRDFIIKGDLPEITEEFNKERGSISPFMNSGVMIDREVFTQHIEPLKPKTTTLLGDILTDCKDVPAEYFIDPKDIARWQYLKGAKKEPRKKSNGDIFFYNEGPMSFPDPLDRPARTIITSEGGATPSRFKHVIEQDGRLRRLTPMELERANMFPDRHTEGVQDTKRAFFMGNALVVGIIERVGIELAKQVDWNCID